MMAMPGEDPNLLYESRQETVARNIEKAEKEKAFIKNQNLELEALKAKRKEARGKRGFWGWAAERVGYADPDKDEVASLDRRIADKTFEMKGYKDATHEIPGTIEIAESRLKTWEREAKNPSFRRTIGKNVWDGSSDTSVVFPKEYSIDAEEYAKLKREEVTIDSGLDPKFDGFSGPYNVPDAVKAQRTMSIENFNPNAFPSDEVLKQSMEQNKKLDTVEESAAKSMEPGSIYTHDIHLEKLLSGLLGDEGLSRAANMAAAAMESTASYHATPVGQHAVPVVREDDEGVSTVQPVHLRDIAESILKDKVGGEAGTGKLQSDELTRIEEVANKQYEEMEEIRKGIQEMVRLLRPSSETVGSGTSQRPRTSFVTKHVSPSIFGQMKDGKPGSGPNRSAYKQ